MSWFRIKNFLRLSWIESEKFESCPCLNSRHILGRTDVGHSRARHLWTIAGTTAWWRCGSLWRSVASRYRRPQSVIYEWKIGKWTGSMGVTLEVTLEVQIGVGPRADPIPVNGWDAVLRSRTLAHPSVLTCIPHISGNVDDSLVVSVRRKHQ